MADEKQKYQNIKAALSDGKTRTIYIGGLVIVIAVIVFAVGSFSGKRNAAHASGPASEVPKPPSVQTSMADAGLKPATPAYDKLVQAENEREAAKAKEQGGSAIPVIRPAADPKPQPQSQPQAAAPQSPQQSDNRQEEERKRKEAIDARIKSMTTQVNSLVAFWEPKGHVNLPVVRDAQGQHADTQGQVVSASSATSSSALAVNSSRPPVKKAGDTCYAVLDTAVNTDEPSPITATIQQCGELNQAKLVGKVDLPQNAQYAQKAQLRFNLINVPGQTTSLPVDAVAIDEATRRSALASDVDNHYFVLYGSLFASAFLGGFGDALIKGGQDEQIVTTPTGAVVQRTAYDTKKLVLAGIGNVGKQAGTNMGSVFNRPATITIDANIGIGIVFMTDLILK
jgi:intracellular multiplication protein IcmE